MMMQKKLITVVLTIVLIGILSTSVANAESGLRKLEKSYKGAPEVASSRSISTNKKQGKGADKKKPKVVELEEEEEEDGEDDDDDDDDDDSDSDSEVEDDSGRTCGPQQAEGVSETAVRETSSATTPAAGTAQANSNVSEQKDNRHRVPFGPEPPPRAPSPAASQDRSPPKPRGSGRNTTDEEKILQDLFKGLMGDASAGCVGGMPDLGDEIPDLDGLLSGLAGGGGHGGDGSPLDTDNFMDGMMEELLSKELMYEPMKQVTEKFPSWLEAQKGKLSPEEWDKRNKQFACFQKLVAAYEGTESEQQTMKILELMQEVQEYGQPPAEIIQDIAPGLELDEEGLPKMNAMPPFMGGGSGNPGEDCRMM
mmetsp:Transcript_20451/g.42030  ORF Transcript_20451/g.42030 Transcript_20451/m.42030 type:complete len:366 (-) Transcript_20451:52-1149(-)